MVENLSRIFPTALGLDQDLGSVGAFLDFNREASGSMEFSEFYASFHRPPGKYKISNENSYVPFFI